MPRQKNEIVVSDDIRAMEVAAQCQHEQEISVQELDSKYLPEGESYNLFVCMSRARDAETTAGQAFIALGQQLALIKAHETSEQFHAAMESLEVSWRIANYAMAAARRFSNSKLVSNFGRTKLQILSVLDDEQITQMEETGSLAGVGTVDEIKQMNRKDLEAALREEKKKRKEERDAQEAAISQKEKKLNELEMELRYREPPTKEQLSQAALDELKKKFFLQVGEASHALHSLMLTIIQAQEIPDVNITQLQGFITIEPEGLLSSLFDYSDTLDEMIENICPARPDTNTEADEMQYAEPVED